MDGPPFCTHLFIEEHFPGFQVLMIMNKAEIKRQVLFGHTFASPLSKHLGAQLIEWSDYG